MYCLSLYKLIQFIVFATILCGSLPVHAETSVKNTKTNQNLLLFIVNCLNKWHFPLHETPESPTPYLLNFTKKSYVFTNLISPSTWTPPAIQELFSSTPFDSSFYLSTTSFHASSVNFSNGPLGKSLTNQGYTHYNTLPIHKPQKPFAICIFTQKLHAPYDSLRQRGPFLPRNERFLYNHLLKNIDDILLVDKPPNNNDFPEVLLFLAFGVRRTFVPIEDKMIWQGIIDKLKGKSGSMATFVAARLPISLRRKLEKVESSDQLSLTDKKNIIDSFNRLVRAPDSPMKEILFGPQITYDNETLFLNGQPFYWWRYPFVRDITQYIMEPNPAIQLRGKHLSQKRKLNRRERLQMRKINREVLELIIPELSYSKGNNLRIETTQYTNWKCSKNYPLEISLLKSLYDENIKDIDTAFENTLKWINRQGESDNTTIVFIGPHGESFMEHNQIEHTSVNCFDEMINPPLIVHIPGHNAQTTFIETQLRMADVLPTVFELMKIPDPRSAVDQTTKGISIARSLNGNKTNITAFSRNEQFSLSIRRNDGWKLLWELGSRDRKLFNVKNDPGETSDLFSSFPQIATELEEEANQFLYGN